MPSKSKTKGSSGERELCKIFSSIFGGSFTRVPNSGAYVGAKNHYRKGILSDTQNRIYRGDLIPPDHMSKLVIESKNYKAFPFHQLMTPGNCPQLDEWIKQTLDCASPGDVWFVCFKVTRVGWYVASPYLDYSYGNHCIYHGTHGSVCITELNDFFQTNRELVLNQAT